jgi:putative ABC transport system permease protein
MLKYAPLVWKNLGRNKLRTFLTGGAIALAISLVCLLATMPAGLDGFLDSLAKNNRISVHNKAGIIYTLPYAYAGKVRSIPGVVEVASWTWFGGAFEEEKGVTFPNFAVDAGTIGVVYEDLGIEKQALEDFRRYRDAMLVGSQTLQKYGWKKGDLVTLKSTVWPVEIEARIVGEIPNDRDPRAWIQREYVEQAMLAKGLPFDVCGIVWARVDDPERVPAIIRQIDETFRNSEAETESETEKSFFGNLFGNLQGFVTVILVVTGLVALSIVFIAANTASMAVRERVGEIAVMKALGFRWKTLFATLVAEATLLSTLAGFAGTAASYGLTRAVKAFAGWNPQLGPLGAFLLTDWVVIQALFLSLFIGMISGVVPSFGAARRSVAATLREVF